VRAAGAVHDRERLRDGDEDPDRVGAVQALTDAGAPFDVLR